MARATEPEGWTPQFREIVPDIDMRAHDLRGDSACFSEALMPDDLRAAGSDGIAYPS